MRARALLGPLALAVAVVVLVVAGQGALAAPPVRHLGPWVEEVGPITAAVALLRLTALGAACWLGLVSLLGTAARLVGAVALAGTLGRALPEPLRRALTGVAGVGVLGSVAVGAAGAADLGAAAAPPAVERLVRLPADPADPPPIETMSVLDEEPAPAPVPPAAGLRGDEVWTVAPGDSFWSIAEDVLADRLGRPPSDPEIDPFWRRMIEANRDRLVTADADLIYPGQELLLPG